MKINRKNQCGNHIKNKTQMHITIREKRIKRREGRNEIGDIKGLSERRELSNILGININAFES
mgnify:CR=1 FL=1